LALGLFFSCGVKVVNESSNLPDAGLRCDTDGGDPDAGRLTGTFAPTYCAE